MLVLASLLFGLMAFVAKAASARLPGPEVAFMRFVVGVVVIAAAASWLRLRPRNHRSLILRGLFGGLAVLLYFAALAHLPVGTATLLTYTSPVFTAVDAHFVLGERVTRGTLAALVLTMLGVVLVVHGHAPPGRLGFGRWELCGLASAALSGAAVTSVRAARRTDGPWEIFAAFCLFGLIATGPFAARVWTSSTVREWLLLLLVGLLAAAAQVLFSHALRHVRAAMSGVISQLTPVTAVALGAMFYGERLPLLSLVGGAITIGAASWTAIAAAQQPELPAAPAEPPRAEVDAVG